MPTATVSIHVPMFEQNAPVQNAAYRGCRSGASERGSAMWALLDQVSSRRLEDVEREHERRAIEWAVPVHRLHLRATAAPGHRACELEAIGAQAGDGLALTEVFDADFVLDPQPAGSFAHEPRRDD